MDSESLEGALDAAARGESVSESLEAFAECFSEDDLEGDLASLRAYVEEHRAEVIGLLGADCDATRHAAAFALSIAPSVDNVEPLIVLLTDQRDFFDHDFAHASLGSLGALAFPGLSRIVEEGGERATQAVQALGQNKGNALPILERLSIREPPVPGLYTAVYNQHDPAALRWMRRGLDSSDAETRSDALSTAHSLLEMARDRTLRSCKIWTAVTGASVWCSSVAMTRSTTPRARSARSGSCARRNAWTS